MSLIIELQQEALDNPNTLQLLRKAHLTAFKLELEDFDSWIQSELNGYDEQATVPAYRMVSGMLMAQAPEFAHGVTINLSKQPMDWPLPTPLSSIDSLLEERDGTSRFALSREAAEALIRDKPSLAGSSIFISVPKAELKKIPEGVRNGILQWALDLEKAGVVGEGLSFTDEEKEMAKRLPSMTAIVNVQGDINAPLQLQLGATSSAQGVNHQEPWH